MSLEARMLESIQHALTQHAEQCLAEPTAILLHPDDHKLLDWDSFSGIPVEPDEKVDPKRIVILCYDHTDPVPLVVDELQKFIDGPIQVPSAPRLPEPLIA